MITADNISIQSRLAVKSLADMQMEIKAGSHGKLVLRGYLADGLGEDTSMGNGITVTIGENGNVSREILFNGIIQDIHIFVENGTKQAIIRAKTPSIRMDIERCSRSFQDTGMTYAQIISRILAGYGGSAPCEKVSLKTGIPVVQYEETDWQFLKRMAGNAGQAVFCDETAAEPCYRLGLPETGRKAVFSEDSYRCMVDESYYHVGKEQGLPRTEFLYYQVESMDNHAIGDRVWYRGRTYYIYEKQAEWKGGVLIFRYKLGGEGRFCGKREYNRKLAGLALPGQVVKTEGEAVYLKLDIDGRDGKAAYPYPWSPVTGNLLYAMPQPGTKAYLHFPDCHEERAYAGSSMYAGKSLPDSPWKRVLGTEYGKQIQLYEDNIALAGGKETGRQLLSLEQESCVLRACDGGLSATAAGGVTLCAPCITIHTPLEINQLKSSRLAGGKGKELKKKGSRNPATGGDASLSMQYEFSGMASQGVLRGTVYEEYLPFEDAPAYEVEYPMEAKILGGIAVALLVGVAVGALVFLAAPVAIGATVAVAIQMGVVAGAVTAVTGILTTVCTAVRDNGEKAIGEYISNAFKSSAAVGGAMLVFLLMPYAAEAMTATVVPYGMTSVPIFGHVVSTSLIEDIIGLSLFEAAGFNAVFKLNDVGMFFLGQKELGEKTGNKLYDDLNELSELASWQIVFWAAMNPRLYANALNNLKPKTPASVAQVASYENPANSGGKTTANPYELQPTHSQVLSNRKLKSLIDSIRDNGIRETIKYVEYNGQMYVVDGHHRLIAAKRLGLTEIPVERVELPYGGYSTVEDLLWFD